MIRSRACLSNTAGQIVNKLPEKMEFKTVGTMLQDRARTIGDIIDRVNRSEARAVTSETLEDAYLRGFAEGQKLGFAEGIAWVKGK